MNRPPVRAMIVPACCNCARRVSSRPGRIFVRRESCWGMAAPPSAVFTQYSRKSKSPATTAFALAFASSSSSGRLLRMRCAMASTMRPPPMVLAGLGMRIMKWSRPGD